MVHLSPPDEHGFCSFGVEVGLSKTIAESSKIIVAFFWQKGDNRLSTEKGTNHEHDRN